MQTILSAERITTLLANDPSLLSRLLCKKCKSNPRRTERSTLCQKCFIESKNQGAITYIIHIRCSL